MSSYMFFSDDYLAHEGRDHLHSKSGRGSGRYAWGSGKNPKQNTKLEMREAKKEEQEQKKREKIETGKSKAITSGNAREIRKYSQYMTNEELDKAMDRAMRMQRLDQLTASQKTDLQRAEEHVNRVMGHVRTVASWVDTTSYAINSVDKLAKTVKPYTKKGREAAAKNKELSALVRSGNTDEIVKRQSELSEAQLKSASMRSTYVNALNKTRPNDKKGSDSASKQAEVSEDSESVKAMKRAKAQRDIQEAMDDVQKYQKLQAKAYDEYSDIRRKKISGDDYSESDLKAARAKVEEYESEMYKAVDRRVLADRVLHPELYDSQLMQAQYKEMNGVIGYYSKKGADAINGTKEYLFGKKR